MRAYDIILAGGGAAGLSLACHLLQSSLRDQRMLLIERNVHSPQDHTWCFWAKQPTLFESIVTRSWDQLQVRGEGFARTLTSHQYRYQMLRGSDVSRFAHQLAATSRHLDFLQGNVEQIEDGEHSASVLVDGQCYSGTWVFDSLFDWMMLPLQRIHTHFLSQQFKGWEIETPSPVFCPDYATLLDFRTSQEQGLHFLYVLPLSERHALVETVLCTVQTVRWETCEQALARYVRDILHIPTYQIVREEEGITPLTDWSFPRQCGKRVMTIGIKGGRVKPSTGYAFARIQRDSTAIVRSLIEQGHPFHVPVSPRRYRFFDSVLLELMTRRKEKMVPIFQGLFRRASAERLWRLLDEDASLWENGLLVPALPSALLWQAACQLAALSLSN